MRAFVLLRLAARSVGRNARRSVLTSAAMVLGLALLIFSRALAEGGQDQMIDSAVALASGHVAIQAPGYLETGKLEDRLDADATSAALAAVEGAESSGILSYTIRLTVDGLASSASSALPVRIEGIDPELEGDFSGMPDRIVDGRYLEPGDRLHAFIGVGLAERLGLDVGNRFVLTAQGASGDVEAQLVRVAGIFRTAIPEMDERLIHIPLETARSWLRAPGSVTTLAVLVPTTRMTEATADELTAVLGGDPSMQVLTWRETSPDLDSAIRIDNYGDFIFLGILFAIVALAILNAVLMAVLGRRREFGILQAMGLTPAETGLIVFGEGIFLTAASGLVGMLAGFLLTWGFFGDGLDLSQLMSSEMTFSGGIIDPVIVPQFHFGQVLASVYSILVIGTVASIYPAIRATRFDVAEAMKFDQ